MNPTATFWFPSVSAHVRLCVCVHTCICRGVCVSMSRKLTASRPSASPCDAPARLYTLSRSYPPCEPCCSKFPPVSRGPMPPADRNADLACHPAAACRNATASHSGLSSTLARCQNCPPLLCKCAWRGCGRVCWMGRGTHAAAASTWSSRLPRLEESGGVSLCLQPWSPCPAVAC